VDPLGRAVAWPVMVGGAATYEFRSASGLEVLTWPAFDGLGVDAVVTTRRGGVSSGPYDSLNLALHVGDHPGSVMENRRRAAGALGARADQLVFCEQVHGRLATTVTARHLGRGAGGADAIPGADALVTATPEPVLVALVADCVPMVLHDPGARVLATVHAGWRGTVAHVAASALDAMVALGADPSRVVVGIGPCVSRHSYEVGRDVAEAVRTAFGGAEHGAEEHGAEELLEPTGNGTWRLDLGEANRRVLRAGGVPAEAIHVADVPTGVGGPFFSHRSARPCGRFGLLARLRP